MKKTVLLITTMLTIISLQSFAQKLEENKVDDFTNKSVKRTSWETLYTTFTANAYFRISNIDNTKYFDFKYQNGTVFSIDNGQELMFKLNNGDIVKVVNLNYTLTCTGCGAKGFTGSGAQGIEVSYPISDEQLKELKANKIVKVRFYTNDGYVENDIKDKAAEKIEQSLSLVE